MDNQEIRSRMILSRKLRSKMMEELKQRILDIIAKAKSGDFWCASICLAQLYADLANLFHKDVKPVTMFADIGEQEPETLDSLVAKLEEVQGQLPESLPVQGSVATQEDAAANPWLSLLMPIVTALLQRLLDRLNNR